MSAALSLAVENAYRIFAPYRIGRRLTVCHCPVCMTEETERALVATPLRSIPAALLAEFTNSAHETAADGQPADELRYFLPRYFALIAAGEVPSHLNIDICLIRLGRSGFRPVWPAEEVEAIDRFFDALVAARLADVEISRWRAPDSAETTYELAQPVGAILACVVTAGGDLPRVLGVWDRAPDPGAAAHMAAVRQRVVWRHGTSLFRNVFLERDHRDAQEAIAAFLHRPAVTQRIEAAFLAASDEKLERVLENGLF